MRTILAIFILMSSTLGVVGQTSFFGEIQNYTDNKTNSPTAFIWASKYWSGSKFGAFVFALNSPNYGEFLIGPSYTFSNANPQRFIEIGIAGGFDSKPRTSAYLFFNANPDSTGIRNKGKWQGLLNVEYGKTGYWYLGFVTYNISNTFAIGCHAQSFNGVWGPRFQFQKSGFMVYTTAGYNLESQKNGVLGGLRYYF